MNPKNVEDHYPKKTKIRPSQSSTDGGCNRKKRRSNDESFETSDPNKTRDTKAEECTEEIICEVSPGDIQHTNKRARKKVLKIPPNQRTLFSFFERTPKNEPDQSNNVGEGKYEHEHVRSSITEISEPNETIAMNADEKVPKPQKYDDDPCTSSYRKSLPKDTLQENDLRVNADIFNPIISSPFDQGINVADTDKANAEAKNRKELLKKNQSFLHAIEQYSKISDTLKALLTDESKALLSKVVALPNPVKRIIGNLYCDGLNYQPLEGVNKKFDTTEMAELKDILFKKFPEDEGETEDDKFEYYTKLLNNDLDKVCSDLNLRKPSKKFQNIDQLREYYNKDLGWVTDNRINSTKVIVLQCLRSRLDNYYKLSDLARNTFDELYILLNLDNHYECSIGTRKNNMTIFTKSYPIDMNIPVENASIVFQDRQEFTRYLDVCLINERWRNATGKRKQNATGKRKQNATGKRKQNATGKRKQNATNDEQSQNATTDELTQNATNVELSQNATNDELTQNASNVELTQNATSDEQTLNATNDDLTQNVTNDEQTQNATNVELSQNATDDEQKQIAIISEAYESFKNLGRESKDMTRYISLPPWLRKFTPAYIYVDILDKGIEILKKAKNYNKAVEILELLIAQVAFRQDKLVEWYNTKRQIQCAYLKQPAEAAISLLEALEAEIRLSEEAKDHLRSHAEQLAGDMKRVDSNYRQKLRQHAEKFNELKNIPEDRFQSEQKKATKSSRPQHKLESGTYGSAEDFCCEKYVTDKNFTICRHWEEKLVNTMFFLLFWDIIYTNLVGRSGIFMSHYQQYPLDMFSEDFYKNRNALIDNRFAIIKNSTVEGILKRMEKHWENVNKYVLTETLAGNEKKNKNKKIEWSNITSVVRCLGPRAVAVICNRLARNYNYARLGFPDLTMYNDESGEIKIVEVKTDNDQYRINQLHWLNYLRKHDIDACFCYLHKI